MQDDDEQLQLIDRRTVCVQILDASGEGFGDDGMLVELWGKRRDRSLEDVLVNSVNSPDPRAEGHHAWNVQGTKVCCAI